MAFKIVYPKLISKETEYYFSSSKVLHPYLGPTAQVGGSDLQKVLVDLQQQGYPILLYYSEHQKKIREDPSIFRGPANLLKNWAKIKRKWP